MIGKYIYIEASDRKPGEKAIIHSESIVGGQSVCVNFWYHMDGADIGSLNVYYKTSKDRVLIWQRKDHVEKMWLFGQASFNTTDTFKVIYK